jgi:hypothetical protein
VPIFTVLAVAAYWSGRKIRNYAQNIIDTGVAPAGSWFWGYPPEDIQFPLTEKVIIKARIYKYFSYVFFALSLFFIIAMIGFTIVSYVENFVK